MAGTKSGWYAGRGIPITVVGTMMLQAAAIVWFAAKMDNRIDVNTASISRNLVAIVKADKDIDKIHESISAQNVINGRLDVTMENVNATLLKLDRNVEALGD